MIAVAWCTTLICSERASSFYTSSARCSWPRLLLCLVIIVEWKLLFIKISSLQAVPWQIHLEQCGAHIQTHRPCLFRSGSVLHSRHILQPALQHFHRHSRAPRLLRSSIHEVLREINIIANDVFFRQGKLRFQSCSNSFNMEDCLISSTLSPCDKYQPSTDTGDTITNYMNKKLAPRYV